VIVTVHPERSARSLFVKERSELVPRADDMPLSAVSALFITDMTQPDADCVAENVSAFVDDHLSVKVVALAIADAALFTVRFALGRASVRLAGTEVPFDGS